jgi:hypothetical protein
VQSAALAGRYFTCDLGYGVLSDHEVAPFPGACRDDKNEKNRD